jgi:hypothetical protein
MKPYWDCKFKDSTMKELYIQKIERKDLEHLPRRENQTIRANDDCKFDFIHLMIEESITMIF